jgi:hypothetical protein
VAGGTPEGGGIVRAAAADTVAAVLDAAVAHAGDHVVLHDRWLPGGSGAYIDHLVIGPCGVWVVDSMQREGRVERRDVGRFLRSEPRLFVDRRDASRLVVGITRQVRAVRDALGTFGEDVHVASLLCFVGASWGRRRRLLEVDGVVVGWPEVAADVVTGVALVHDARDRAHGPSASRTPWGPPSNGHANGHAHANGAANGTRASLGPHLVDEVARTLDRALPSR